MITGTTEDYKEDFNGFNHRVSKMLDENIEAVHKMNTEIRILRWEKRLTKKQYKKYLNGKLQPFDALDVSDVMREREFRYCFNTGVIVKLDWEMLSPSQQEFFIDLKDLHAVVTKCWSDLHAFSHGSSYSHDLRFENGDKSPKEPFVYDLFTFEPLGRIPTHAIIAISKKEQKYYDKEFKNRKPNQKLWWYHNDL